MATLSSSLPSTATFCTGVKESKTRTGVTGSNITIFQFGTRAVSPSLSYSSQVSQKLLTAFASGGKPSSEDSLKERAKGSETGGAEDPPFLTILAGLVVFFVICWIFGSIVMWLIGLVLNVFSSK